MTEAEIRAIVDKLADIAAVLHDADPEDKGEIFRQLGFKLTYHPGRQPRPSQGPGAAIDELLNTNTTAQIADILNSRGLTSGEGSTGPAAPARRPGTGSPPRPARTWPPAPAARLPPG
jgi:hypothetical protein